MKIKGVIEDLKKKKKILIKKNNSKNMSRIFSGAVVGRVGLVQFQIATCSTVYFSISIGPFQCNQC